MSICGNDRMFLFLCNVLRFVEHNLRCAKWKLICDALAAFVP